MFSRVTNSIFKFEMAGCKSVKPNRLFSNIRKSTYQVRQNDLNFQGKAFNIPLIQVYGPTTNAKEGKVVWFKKNYKTFHN